MECEECGSELTEREEEVTNTINHNWCYHCAFSVAKKGQGLTNPRGMVGRMTGWLKQLTGFISALFMGGRL